jgi:hypothetical protein
MNAKRTEEEVGFQIGYERASYGVCRQDLDAMGERAVRDALNSGTYGHAGLAPFAFVSAWLADKEFLRTEEAASNSKAAAAAATAAAISAAEATTLARQARNITIAFAVISTVVSIVALILKK